MFHLKSPCKSCPFRKGYGERYNLCSERIDEIVAAPAFQCHATVDYKTDSPSPGNRPQQCAGLMAVLHREGTPNQIMQVAMRLSCLDPETLDPENQAYATLQDARNAHEKG